MKRAALLPRTLETKRAWTAVNLSQRQLCRFLKLLSFLTSTPIPYLVRSKMTKFLTLSVLLCSALLASATEYWGIVHKVRNSVEHLIAPAQNMYEFDI